MKALSRLIFIVTGICFISHAPCLAATDIKTLQPPTKTIQPAPPPAKVDPSKTPPKPAQRMAPVPENTAPPALMDRTKPPRVAPAGRSLDQRVNPAIFKPDLTVKMMKIEPANPTVHDTIRFSAFIQNIGVAHAGPSMAGIKIGGETFPMKFQQGPISSQSSTAVVRLKKLNKAGRYRVKFIADVDNQVAESNENNNEGALDFEVSLLPMVSDSIPGTQIDPNVLQIVFQVFEQNLLTYTFPGSNSFTVYLRTTKNIDASTISGAIRVHLKLFDGNVMQSELDLGQASLTAAGNLITWSSTSTNYASACTATLQTYCQVDVYAEDSIMSQDGDSLDGNKDGQPGGQYHHTFYRGNGAPSP